LISPEKSISCLLLYFPGTKSQTCVVWGLKHVINFQNQNREISAPCAYRLVSSNDDDW